MRIYVHGCVDQMVVREHGDYKELFFIIVENVLLSPGTVQLLRTRRCAIPVSVARWGNLLPFWAIFEVFLRKEFTKLTRER